MDRPLDLETLRLGDKAARPTDLVVVPGKTAVFRRIAKGGRSTLFMVSAQVVKP